MRRAREAEARATSLLLARCREFRSTDPGLTVLASGSHHENQTDDFIRQFQDPQVSSIGSSLKMVKIAEGAWRPLFRLRPALATSHSLPFAPGLADVYPRYAPTMEWDTCAADIIVSEAGGHMINADGQVPAAWQMRTGRCHNACCACRRLPLDVKVVQQGPPLQYNKPNLLSPNFVVLGRLIE